MNTIGRQVVHIIIYAELKDGIHIFLADLIGHKVVDGLTVFVVIRSGSTCAVAGSVANGQVMCTRCNTIVRKVVIPYVFTLQVTRHTCDGLTQTVVAAVLIDSDVGLLAVSIITGTVGGDIYLHRLYQSDNGRVVVRPVVT